MSELYKILELSEDEKEKFNKFDKANIGDRINFLGKYRIYLAESYEGDLRWVYDQYLIGDADCSIEDIIKKVKTIKWSNSIN